MDWKRYTVYPYALTKRFISERILGAPRSPMAADVERAQAQIEAATAQINNAYDESNQATAFSVRYKHRDYVITNAHVVTNREDQSRGFHLKGKQYFILARGNHIAAAEHLLLNPVGIADCEHNHRLDLSKPYRDIAILKLLSPGASRDVLSELTWSEDGRNRLMKLLQRTGNLASTTSDRYLSERELKQMTNGFQLVPVPVYKPTPREQNTALDPTAYSVAFYKNIPNHTLGNIKANVPNETDSRIRYQIYSHDRRSPKFTQGHSGSLIYDVTDSGSITPIGMTKAVNTDGNSYFIPFDQIIEGLDILHRRIPVARQGHVPSCLLKGVSLANWVAPVAMPALAPTLTAAQKPSSKHATFR